MLSLRRLVVSALTGIAVAMGFAAASPVGAGYHREPLTAPAANTNTNAGMVPKTVQIGGRTHYYQIPANPRGTLVVLPGCSRTGYGFWPFGAGGCAECAGLTEDVAHTKQALARGYAVVVFTAAGKALCWGADTDAKFLQTAIPEFLNRNAQLKNKPIVVMGASSGGGLMLRSLGSMGVRFSGVIALVATKREVREFDLKAPHPPIVWVTMSEPREIAAAKDRVAQYKKYAPAAMASAAAHKVTDSFFSDRHPLITPQQSAQMAAQLRKMGVVGADGRILQDPKANRAWLTKLQQALPFLKTKDFQVAPIQKAALLQAMLVAWSKHDHVCDYLTASLIWFEKAGKPNFDELARKYRVVRPAALTMARQADGAEPTPAAAFAYGSDATQLPTFVPKTSPPLPARPFADEL